LLNSLPVIKIFLRRHFSAKYSIAHFQITFKYISKILFLPQTNSIIKVKYTSSPFLIQPLPCHRKHFSNLLADGAGAANTAGFLLLYAIAFFNAVPIKTNDDQETIGLPKKLLPAFILYEIEFLFI